MKTIIYFLLGLFIFSTVATGFLYKPHTSATVFIEAIEPNVTPDVLTRSAEIISNRLKDYGFDHFEVNTIPLKEQIQVIFSGRGNISVPFNLLENKGALNFREVYTRKEFRELAKNDTGIFSRLNNNPYSPMVMGCINDANNIGTIDGYIASRVPDHRYQFAWGRPRQNSEICLYALKKSNDGRIVLTGSDLDSIFLSHEINAEVPQLTFRFNKSAATVWAEITRRNINRPVAVVLDGEVLFAPIVRAEITDGNGEITGNFTREELKNIVALIHGGELPVGFRVVDTQ